MPDPSPVTGPHTPITNLPASETIIITQMISEGSVGSGDELTLAPGAKFEILPVIGQEAFIEGSAFFNVPDLTGLADIGIATFGAPPRIEAVIGTDDRVQVRNTEQYPWRATASLLITAADNSQWIGTGWFISPRTLVTAGHCVYIKNSGVPNRDGWVKKIQVMPGRNADKLPFGGVTATEFLSVKGWGDNGLENYDYGAIILPAAFSKDIGTMSFGVFDDALLLEAMANVAGYPGDKPPGTMWYDNENVGSINPDKIFYAADTAGGQSGAFVYMIKDRQRIGIAIHNYGGRISNSGTRISSPVFTNLMAWKRT